MFRYIKLSSELDNTPFKRTTDTSYYDNFLNDKDLKYMEKAKNRTGRIEMMSPNEYYRHCAEDVFDVTVDKLRKQRTNELSEKYVQEMLKGDKFPLCYIDYASPTQEGLHRMKAAGDAFGWDTKFPVLCVYVFDQERENRYKKIEEMRDFERWNLEKCCEKAQDELTDLSKPVPDDIADQFKDLVVKFAKEEYGHDIEVDVSVYETDGYHRLNCELITFDGMENDYPENRSNSWIEDMFDTDTEDDDELSDIDIDSIDLDYDDIDIDSLLFK